MVTSRAGPGRRPGLVRVRRSPRTRRSGRYDAARRPCRIRGSRARSVCRWVVITQRNAGCILTILTAPPIRSSPSSQSSSIKRSAVRAGVDHDIRTEAARIGAGGATGHIIANQGSQMSERTGRDQMDGRGIEEAAARQAEAVGQRRRRELRHHPFDADVAEDRLRIDLAARVLVGARPLRA